MSRPNEYNWIFGAGDHLKFVNIGSDVSVETPLSPSPPLSFYEGCASVSDQNGDLIAFTNGVDLWDSAGVVKNNVPLNDPDNLTKSTSSTQSAIIVPPAGSGQHYHVFSISADDDHGTVDVVTHTTFERTGSTINIVVPPTWLNNSLIPGFDNHDNTERLAAISHHDCDKYWVITQQAGYGRFYVLLVGDDNTPSQCNLWPTANIADDSKETGYMKFSPDGSRLAWCQRKSNKVHVHGFDNITGAITDEFSVSVDDPYGLEFSPDGQKIYISSPAHKKVSVCDVASQTVNEIYPTASNPSNAYAFCALQLGPNNTIYGKVEDEPHLLSILDSNNPSTTNCVYPALDYLNVPIVVDANTISLPTFTRIAESCKSCGISLLSQECDANGNTVLVIEMVNNTSNANVTMNIDLSGIPPSMYSVGTTSAGNIHQATINIDGIFSGPITIKGSLSGFAGNLGARLCCDREISIDIDACSADCLEIDGTWSEQWIQTGSFPNIYALMHTFSFTVTNVSSNPSFQPIQVDITNLPSGAVISPNPIPLVNGIGNGTITGLGAPGSTHGLIFHTENWDMCCNKWINLTVPNPFF